MKALFIILLVSIFCLVSVNTVKSNGLQLQAVATDTLPPSPYNNTPAIPNNPVNGNGSTIPLGDTGRPHMPMDTLHHR